MFPAALDPGQRVTIEQDEGQGRVTITESSQPEIIVGSGKMTTKTWDLADFSRVQIRSNFHAKIVKGKQFKVTTTADDNLLPFIQVVKDGNLLKIGLEKNRSFQLKKAPEAEIVLPVLAGVDMSGATIGHLEGFDSEKEVSVHMTGASKLDGTLSSAKARLETSGASRVTLHGGAQEAELLASGASQLLLGEFPLKQGKLELSGASTADIVVRTTAPFTATMSGASKLRGKLETAELVLTTEGASHVDLDGSAKRAKVSVTGASHLELDGVKAESMNITVSGASHAKVAVSESLDYEVSSVSHLTYKGDPAHVEGKRSGGSHVSHE